jgi:hypothetical protein
METPPDTIRQDFFVLKNRLGGGAAKPVFDISAAAASLETPFSAQNVPFDRPEEPVPVTPEEPTVIVSVGAILRWSNPQVSAAFAVLTAILVGTGHLLMSNWNQTTLLSGKRRSNPYDPTCVAQPLYHNPLSSLPPAALCYGLLADLGLHFFLSLISQNWNNAAGWGDSRAVAAIAKAATWTIDELAVLHDRFLASSDPTTTLKAGATLWACAILGRHLSILNIITLAAGAAFAIPPALAANRDAVNDAIATATSGLRSRWVALGLSRMQQFLTLVALLMAVLYKASWATRLVGSLMVAMVVRCNLMPAEVAAIRQCVKPYTQSVKKGAGRLTTAASAFAQRNLGSKLHLR